MGITTSLNSAEKLACTKQKLGKFQQSCMIFVLELTIRQLFDEKFENHKEQ